MFGAAGLQVQKLLMALTHHSNSKRCLPITAGEADAMLWRDRHPESAVHSIGNADLVFDMQQCQPEV